jgi:hypothetical protein
MIRKITAQEFWDWFITKSEFLMDLDNSNDKDQLIKEFEEVLASYSEGLSFEISELSQNGRSITFSAEGDEDYFEDVIELTNNVPILDFWDIVAFKQPQGERVRIKFENYSINSKDLWFIPMENDEELSEKVGIMVGINDLNEEDEDQLIAVYTLIEAMIGEYDCTTLLGYFELCLLPENPEQEGFIPLTQLPEFIAWHLNKIDNIKD